MAASDNLHPDQFAPLSRAKEYDSSVKFFRLTNKQVAHQKSRARQEMASSRSARLAGDQRAADQHRQNAAVHRDQAMAGASAKFHPYRSTRERAT